MTTIQKKCDKLNRDIHNRLFLNNYLSITIGDYERVFTSIDLIEDSQNAIEEFENIPENSIRPRTTLYIYGVLQSMYCQQDGLFHLYRTIINKDIIHIYELFELFQFNKEIREVRDDIAGHPVDRKKGKEFYFIAKGTTSKYDFSYAGYTPHFRNVNVNLKQFIKEQNDFVYKILNEIEAEISKKITDQKNKYKAMKLVDTVNTLNYPIQLIYRGIFDNYPLTEMGLSEITRKLDQLKTELNLRYNNKMPDSITDIFRLQDYILIKVANWINSKTLQGNLDAEIFMDSFSHQLDELLQILKEIDDDFGS